MEERMREGFGRLRGLYSDAAFPDAYPLKRNQPQKCNPGYETDLASCLSRQLL